MGSEYFEERVHTEKSVKEAFRETVEAARWDFGHAGYTGTIAEKDSFKVLGTVESWEEAMATAAMLAKIIDDQDRTCYACGRPLLEDDEKKKIRELQERYPDYTEDKWEHCNILTVLEPGQPGYLMFGWASS